MADRPNVIYFQVDNLGYGELGCYGGGVLRGADTRRVDQFAQEGSSSLKRFASSGDRIGVVLAAWPDETNCLPPQRPRPG